MSQISRQYEDQRKGDRDIPFTGARTPQKFSRNVHVAIPTPGRDGMRLNPDNMDQDLHLKC
jgi:hypothetical protein